MTVVYCTWQGITPTSKAMYAEGDTEEPCYNTSRCSTHTDWWRVRQRWKEGHRKRSGSELRRVVSRKQAQTEFVRKWGKSTFCLCQTPSLDKFSCIRQWTGVLQVSSFLTQYPHRLWAPCSDNQVHQWDNTSPCYRFPSWPCSDCDLVTFKHVSEIPSCLLLLYSTGSPTPQGSVSRSLFSFSPLSLNFSLVFLPALFNSSHGLLQNSPPAWLYYHPFMFIHPPPPLCSLLLCVCP